MSLGDRTKYIGGSDIPVILGESKFKKRQALLFEKLGLKKGFSGTIYSEFGHHVEDDLIWCFEMETGLSASGQQDEIKGDLFGFPFIGHIDGKVDVGDNDCDFELLEIKTTGMKYKKDWENGLPLYYKGQVQFYMHFSGMKKAHIVVGFRETADDGKFYVKEHKILTEEYDAEYIEKSMPIIEQFVKDMLEGKTGEESEFLNEGQLSYLLSLKERKSEIESEIKDIEEKIKSKILIDKNYICGNYQVSYSKVVSSRVDTEKMKADGIYEKYTKKAESKRFNLKESEDKNVQ